MKRYKVMDLSDNVNDPRCKQNTIKPISNTNCKNNCGRYDRLNKKCKLGYEIYQTPRENILGRGEE